ncbi:MAG: ABC transporter substrate-binding protein [Magnetospirillum sp. WYHS-4]
MGAAASAAAAWVPSRFAIGGEAPVRIGIMLPYTGVYAQLGENITSGLTMRLKATGDKLGGRTYELHKVDSEANPSKAVDNATKLVKGKDVDFVVGPVHSGVALAMTKVMAKSPKTIMICPNAGADELTRGACLRNVFRTSFSNWQTGFSMGAEVLKRGHRRVVTLTWKYAAGQEMMAAFGESFRKAGGADPVEQLWVDFPDAEFQPVLTRIAALKPDAVFAFFSGSGAVKFIRDYDTALDRKQIPLYGTGFLTEGVLDAVGNHAEGIVTALHWAETLDSPENRLFLGDFRKTTGRMADVFAVQGWDTGTLLYRALDTVKGDTGATKDLIQAMEDAEISGPRGVWHMSKSHNPIQDFYLRQVEGGRNKVLGIAHAQLEDPGTGCKM